MFLHSYLLPPIIFFAGLSVKKKHFFRNLPTISAFGVLGTYACFTIIALVLYSVSHASGYLSLADCLALGAIFAATDSVAVLQVGGTRAGVKDALHPAPLTMVLSAMLLFLCCTSSGKHPNTRPPSHCCPHCNWYTVCNALCVQVLDQDKKPLLFSLVFGEGIINDAVSIVLLAAVQVRWIQSCWPWDCGCVVVRLWLVMRLCKGCVVATNSPPPKTVLSNHTLKLHHV